MFCQCTLAESVAAVGIGLHSGRKIRLVLHPAPEDSGIVFRRVDLNPPVDIPAAPMNVNDTRMATTVNAGNPRHGWIRSSLRLSHSQRRAC